MCARTLAQVMTQSEFHWAQSHVHKPSSSKNPSKPLFELSKTNMESIEKLKAWKETIKLSTPRSKPMKSQVGLRVSWPNRALGFSV